MFKKRAKRKSKLVEINDSINGQLMAINVQKKREAQI